MRRSLALATLLLGVLTADPSAAACLHPALLGADGYWAQRETRLTEAPRGIDLYGYQNVASNLLFAVDTCLERDQDTEAAVQLLSDMASDVLSAFAADNFATADEDGIVTWHSDGRPHIVLERAQFLYFVASLLRVIADHEDQLRPHLDNDSHPLAGLVRVQLAGPDSARATVPEHLYRHLRQWSLNGKHDAWALPSRCPITRRGQSHRNFLRRATRARSQAFLRNTDGVDQLVNDAWGEPHCFHTRDQHMWIMAGVIDLLAANDLFDWPFIGRGDVQRWRERPRSYINLIHEFIAGNVAPHTTLNWEGRPVSALRIDAGLHDWQGWTAFAGLLHSAAPGDTQGGNVVPRPAMVGCVQDGRRGLKQISCPVPTPENLWAAPLVNYRNKRREQLLARLPGDPGTANLVLIDPRIELDQRAARLGQTAGHTASLKVSRLSRSDPHGLGNLLAPVDWHAATPLAELVMDCTTCADTGATPLLIYKLNGTTLTLQQTQPVILSGRTDRLLSGWFGPKARPAGAAANMLLQVDDRAQTATLWRWQEASDATPAGPVAAATVALPGLTAGDLVLVADLNGDRRDDLLYTRGDDIQVGINLEGSIPTFETLASLKGQRLHATRRHADGPDLLLTTCLDCDTPETVHQWQLKGEDLGAVKPVGRLPVGPELLWPADVDGDGETDLVYRDMERQALAVSYAVDGVLVPHWFGPVRARGVGYDTVHARRYVHFFETLYRSAQRESLSFPSLDDMQMLANQYAYVVFNGVFDVDTAAGTGPLFSNYFSGHNGWSIMHKGNDPGYGYPPSGLSIAGLSSGFGYWARYNPDIRKLTALMVSLAEAPSDSPLGLHRNRYYSAGGFLWSRFYRKFKKIDPLPWKIGISLYASASPVDP